MNVTRAVLPVMRKQRSGHVVTITSTAGIVGQEFCSAYAASKFALEGWMESLRFEVAPLGIHTTIVEPWVSSAGCSKVTAFAERAIDDYAERTAQTLPAWEAMSGKQGGDPAKLAKALVTLVDSEQPPLRWVAGADAVETVERKARELLAQVDAHRELSTSLAFDELDRTRQGGWVARRTQGRHHLGSVVRKFAPLEPFASTTERSPARCAAMTTSLGSSSGTAVVGRDGQSPPRRRSAPHAGAPRYGAMFWLRRKKLVGSYARLSATRRS